MKPETVRLCRASLASRRRAAPGGGVAKEVAGAVDCLGAGGARQSWALRCGLVASDSGDPSEGHDRPGVGPALWSHRERRGQRNSIPQGQRSRARSARCPVERSLGSRPGQEATRLDQRVHEYQIGLSERFALTPRGGTRDCRGHPKNRRGIAAARRLRRRGSRGAFHGATKVGWSRHVHCGRPSRWQTRVGRLTRISWGSHDPVGSELPIKQALNVGRTIRGWRQWKEP